MNNHGYENFINIACFLLRKGGHYHSRTVLPSIWKPTKSAQKAYTIDFIVSQEKKSETLTSTGILWRNGFGTLIRDIWYAESINKY